MIEWVRTHRTIPLAELMAALNQKLVGYYHDYGVTDNRPRLDAFLAQVRRVLFKWLNPVEQAQALMAQASSSSCDTAY